MNRPAISAYLPLRRSTGVAVKPDKAKPLAVAAIATLAIVTAIPARAAEPGSDDGVSVLSIIGHTPAWVWLVLAGLIWLGLARTRDRDVGLRSLVVFPLIMIALAAYNLAGSGLIAAIVAGLGIGVLLGLAAGIFLERRNGATRLDRGRVHLKGEWTSLVVVLVVFLTRYVKTVIGNIDPAITLSDGFEFTTAGLSGFFAAVLLTRTLMRLRVAFA